MDPNPDKDVPEKKPPKRDLADFDPAEREFWETADEEEAEIELPAGDQDDLEESPGEEAAFVADSEENNDLLEEDDDLLEADDLLAEDLEEWDREGGQEEEEARGEDAEAEEQPGSPAEEAGGKSGSRTISRTDFVWMGLLGVVLLIIAIYGLSLFFKNVQPSKSPHTISFPVEGDKVVIGKVETFWRKPDRSVDKVSLDAMLIPCAVVKLKSGAGASRLRLFFENQEGEYVGDPITLAIADGTFASSGEAEIEIYGTEGFEHEGQYAAYVTENLRFWYLNIFEGPATDQDGGRFEKITRIRLSPKRR